MSDWNEVLTVLNHDPDIDSWALLPGVERAVLATVITENHGKISMMIENGSNDLWLQLRVTISDTTEGSFWEAAGWYLRDLPAIGLTQMGDGVAIRHGILLPHANIHAITNGITLTAFAAGALFDAASQSNN